MLAIGVTAPALGLAAAMIGTAIPAQAASAVHYVALGDSYSAGVGAGGSSGSCGQSPNAFPALWAKANSPASFASAACTGATTIGGNDAGFSSIMETCVLKSTSSCESVVSSAEKYVASALPAQLNTMLTDIRSHAPSAKIVVLDYPDFYDLSAWLCLGLSRADHQALDTGINDLDGALQSAAARNGDTFADVRAQFSDHELCGGSSWLNSVTLPIANSYHPTAAGQQDGYLPPFAVAAA
jgi:lysophospholipase L1-like esterase